jgi:hypothetical protein
MIVEDGKTKDILADATLLEKPQSQVRLLQGGLLIQRIIGLQKCDLYFIAFY